MSMHTTEKNKDKVAFKEIFIIIICALVFLAYYWFAFLMYPNVSDDSTFEETFEKKVTQLQELYNIPAIGIAIVNDNRIEYQKAFGLIDIDAAIEYNSNSPIRVQSISKSVTSLAVIKLIEKYDLEIDQPFKDYINLEAFDEFSPEIYQLSLEDLLTHKSGLTLGNIFAMYDPYDEIPPLEKSLKQTISFNTSLSGAFNYSNTGYNFLEWIIESVSKQSFEEFVSQEVLRPLNMDDSTFDYHKLNTKPTIAGYNITHNPVSMYVYPEKASGELFSTLTDMTNFIDYLASIQVSDVLSLDSTSKSSMFTTISNDIGVYNFVYDGYGYGFYVEELENENFAIAHGGQGAGVMSHFHVLPNEQSGIVVLTNSQRSWPMIAHLLSMYRRMYRFEPIKMETLIILEATSFAFLGCLFGLLVLNLKKLISMIKQKKVTSSLMKSLIALLFALLVLWGLSQDYLLLTSILPISGYALLLLVLLISLSYLVRPVVTLFNAIKQN